MATGEPSFSKTPYSFSKSYSVPLTACASGEIVPVSFEIRGFRTDYDEKITARPASAAYAFDARAWPLKSPQREVMRQPAGAARGRIKFDLKARALA